MVDKIASDARIYTDIQGLENLRYQSGTQSAAVKKEISHQFEAMLMQMVMRSMRDANKSLSSDLFGSESDQMDFYQDMFDKQLSMSTSMGQNSFANIVEKNIDQQYFPNSAAVSENSPPAVSTMTPPVKSAVQIVQQPPPPVSIAVVSQSEPIISNSEKPVDETIHSPEEFVKKLWASAKAAASVLGADPKILIAQAALETNWGKKILPSGKDNSSFNLFNIKADSSWDKKTTTMSTLEQQDGVIAKVKATFRSYGSFAESFKDYVSFLKQNGRYTEALSKAPNPQQFVNELQKAGFATDTNYGEKVLKIFSSGMFKRLVGKME